MPNIPQYETPQSLVPRPDEGAANVAREAAFTENRFSRESGEALGGAVSRVGSQLGEAVDDHISAQLISHGAAVSMQGYADLTNKWNSIAENADPNDTSVAAGFQEKIFNPWAENFLKQYDSAPEKARNWAMSTVNEMRSHLFEKQTADMGVRASAAFTKNFNTGVQAAQLAASNEPDLHTISFLVGKFTDDTKALLSSSSVSVSERARIETEMIPDAVKQIVRAGVMGAGRINPDALIASINNGDIDKIPGLTYSEAEKTEALKYAEEQKRNKQIDEEHALTMQEKQKKAASDVLENQAYTDIINGHGSRAMAVAARASSALTPEARKSIPEFIAARTREIRENQEGAVHPEEFRHLITSLNDTAENNPQNLSLKAFRDAYNKGEISYKELTQGEERFNNINRPYEQNFNNMVKSTVSPIVMRSPQFILDKTAGQGVINQIEYDAYRTLNKYRDSGKDVTPLFDPKSSEYLFSPAKIQSYITPAKQMIATQANQVKSAAGGSLIFNGYKFPNQEALDAYKKASGQ